MVTLRLPVEVINIEQDTETLNIKVAQELADLTEEAQPDFEPGCAAEAAHWRYRMPFPGVRYYGYDE